MGCHYFDLAFWALNLRYPQTIEAEGPPPHPESTPAWQHVRYQFPAREGMPPVRSHLDARRQHQEATSLPGQQGTGLGLGIFVGSRGLLAVNYGQWKLLPDDEFAGYKPPEPSIPDSLGHHQEWIIACKTGSPTSCNFDYAGAITETLLLGNVAYRTGQKLEWDGPNMRVTNCPEANNYLQRDYRPGWTL